MADGCFLTALQPNSSCTAYAVPSDGRSADPSAKVRRVQEQVRMRLAEKKSASLSRLSSPQLGPAAEYSPPDMRSYSQAHAFSSRSMINTPSRPMAVPSHASGISSHSAVDSSSKVRHKETSSMQSSFHSTQMQSRSHRSKSLSQEDQRALPLPGSVHQETFSVPLSVPPPGTLRRSLSGVLAQERGQWQDEELPLQYTYKGPSHRMINRITNRQQYYQQQSSGFGQDAMVANGRGLYGNTDSVGAQWQHQTSRTSHASAQYAPLHRAASLRSLRSVGKGADIADAASIHSNDPLAEMQSIDMPTAVRYLSESNTSLQVLGSAYIQHQCYHSNDAKNQVRVLGGIPSLVRLFSSDSIEVQRYATAATRNLIYENAENKVALIEAGGLASLVNILNQHDEELWKTITGVLWNLSSRDNLKEKLAVEVLPLLTEKVLVPLCKSIPLNPSEREIFNNTTGCLRNLSSVNERTRRKMRQTQGLLDSLVCYIQQEEIGDDKGLENSLCVMRNLSYQLYAELPPSVRLQLEGPSRASASRTSEIIGCFTVQSKKKTQLQHRNLPMLSHPKGSEWLWHPKVVALYKHALQNSEGSAAAQEAAVGALQNVTSGEARWPAVLSGVVTEQERMLPMLLDLLDSSSEMLLRPLTGLLRNLARHAADKDLMAKISVNVLVCKLPSDGLQKTPSSEVVVNICGVLNHLVTCSSLAARDIAYFNGIQKLHGIKTSHDNSSGSLRAARAASTVLCNMFQYNKLHRDYKLRGFTRQNFIDSSF